MARVTPGVGRNRPEQATSDQAYAQFLSWFSYGEVEGKEKREPKKYIKPGAPKVEIYKRLTNIKPGWPRRTTKRPTQTTKKTKNIKIITSRYKLKLCSRQWKSFSKLQKSAWSNICIVVVKGTVKNRKRWQVRGKKAFMSACLLGFMRPCRGILEIPVDLIDPVTGLPIDLLPGLEFYFKIVDINGNPINKANVQIKSQKWKIGNDLQIIYTGLTGEDGYPLSYCLSEALRPFNITVTKIYESQRKKVTVTADTQVDLIMC